MCKLISRNGNEFKSFAVLNEAIESELKVRSAVLDGEIVCLDADRKPQFRDLLFRRGEPRFVAFDLLRCDGEDLRCLPLIERKRRLRSIVRNSGDRLLYCDHVEHDISCAAMAIAAARVIIGLAKVATPFGSARLGTGQALWEFSKHSICTPIGAPPIDIDNDADHRLNAQRA